GIDTDDEVEIDDQRRGIREVMKVGGKIVERHPARRGGRLSNQLIFLQRDEADTRYLTKRPHRVESDRAAAGKGGFLGPVQPPATGPYEPDPQSTETSEPLMPIYRERRVRGHVRRRRRNCIESRAEGTGQAQ